MAVVDVSDDGVATDKIADYKEFCNKTGCGGLVCMSALSARASILGDVWENTASMIASRYNHPGLCNPPDHGIPVLGLYRSHNDLAYQG